jgi:hypothetical protein
VTLHDELHLLEVLMQAITPHPEYTAEYWQLSSEVITFGEDLRAAYEAELERGGSPPDNKGYDALRRRLTGLQARAQALTLHNEVEP